MACIDPKLTNGKIWKHYSLSSPSERLHFLKQVFDCGSCLFCRRKRSYELALRCVLHASLFDQNCFLTLTHDETRPGYTNELDYTEIQKFKKRLRSYVTRKFNKKIEIFNVHEYGKNGKKHWHLVVFGFDFEDKTVWLKKPKAPLYVSDNLTRLWGFGHCTLGLVEEASAMYQAQYMEKDRKNGNLNNSKKSKSNHRGIGAPYFRKHFVQLLSNMYVSLNGRKIPLPRSFEKIAHKHWAYYYDQSYFFDQYDAQGNITRKRRYTMKEFKTQPANKEMAELWITYDENKQARIPELAKEWDEIIKLHLETGEKPEFWRAGENAMYELQNKNLNTIERF